MSGKRDAARAALRRSAGFLAPEHHDQIFAALSDEGLLDDKANGGRVHAVADGAALPKRMLMTPIECAQAKGGANKDLLASVMANARRLGFVIDPAKQVDTVAMDAALKGRDVTERLALKAAMHKLGLIK